MEKDVSKIFNKFAGREIEMVETTKRYGSRIRGIYKELSLKDPCDPTLTEMAKVAKENGLTLRILWPGLAGTMEMRPDRVTTYIEKQLDGKYRISNRFDIG